MSYRTEEHNGITVVHFGDPDTVEEVEVIKKSRNNWLTHVFLGWGTNGQLFREVMEWIDDNQPQWFEEAEEECRKRRKELEMEEDMDQEDRDLILDEEFMDIYDGVLFQDEWSFERPMTQESAKEYLTRLGRGY